MARRVGTWLLGLAALTQTSCYQHHTADEELLDLDLPDVGDAGDGDGAAPVADAGVGAGDAGLACTGTDILSQITCALQPRPDAGTAQPNINDLINSVGGLGAITDLLGGLGGLGGAGARDGGAAQPGAADCQNAGDVFTQFICSLQGGGGIPRRDGGRPPAQPPMPDAAVVEDAGALDVGDGGVPDAAADAAADGAADAAQDAAPDA